MLNLLEKELRKKKNREKNIIVIEIENEIISLGSAKYEDAIQVEAKLNVQGRGDKFQRIKPSLVKMEGKEVLYHYLIFDMCHMDEKSVIEISMKVNSGSFVGKMTARIDEIQRFEVICPEKNTDVFEPRDYHASCTTWDLKLWVFGGKQSIGKRSQVLNDLMKYDEKENRWVNASPKRGDAPAPRYGHSMFCFYNYLFVFGGMGDNNHVFGDLWVFDIIREDWRQIMDAERTHQLKHQNIKGVIPAPRAFHSFTMLEEFGAAVMIGGMTTNEVVTCDIWTLDLDVVVNQIESSEPTQP